jgi:hypothetical protein
MSRVFCWKFKRPVPQLGGVHHKRVCRVYRDLGLSVKLTRRNRLMGAMRPRNGGRILFFAAGGSTIALPVLKSRLFIADGSKRQGRPTIHDASQSRRAL